MFIYFEDPFDTMFSYYMIHNLISLCVATYFNGYPVFSSSKITFKNGFYYIVVTLTQEIGTFKITILVELYFYGLAAPR